MLRQLLVVLMVWGCGLAVGHAWGAEAPGASAGVPTAPAAGHSLHGEAFNHGPRQQAYLMPGMGQVTFPITTKSAPAQAFFNQGVGQLHGFWYFEAERSFRQVAMLDPECAMAYWGMAMANVNNAGRAKTMSERAVKRKGLASRREQLYIEGLAAFHAAGPEKNKERRRDYVRALESIIQEFPDDVEAKALLAVALWDNDGHGWPISSHQAVDALLDQVFAVQPAHPAHHYRIHLWDREKSVRALASAAACGPAAPGIAHMWHMPGHIYSNLHRYDDACWMQEASARVDHAHMIRDRVLPDQIHNYAHNNEWLIRNLAYAGRVRDAVELSKNLIELPRHPKFNSLKSGGMCSAKFGRERLLQVLLRFELWEQTIELSDTMYLEPTDVPAEQAVRLRARGLAFFGRGLVDHGRAQLAHLQALVVKGTFEQKAAGDAAEKQARDEKKPDAELPKARQQAEQAFVGRIEPMRAAVAELEAWSALAGGDLAGAAERLAKAADVPRDRQIRFHLGLGDLAKAEQLAREEVQQGSQQTQPLAVLTDVLQRAGKPDQARETLEKLRPISQRVDLDAPAFARLAPLARSLGWPDDWRQSAAAPADIGPRPALDMLGPFRWHPAAAAAWSLPSGDGATLSLGQFQGRPLVLMFYLGSSCPHCVQQLQAFAARARAFGDAGIALAAISTESLEEFKTGAAELTKAGPLPFAVACDPAKEVFRAYRAHDDFENSPLHGTFLVDGRGQVRWQDISFEPFLDTQFLLDEARRLLSLP